MAKLNIRNLDKDCFNYDGHNDCSTLYNCCDCGGNDCGCRYCFSCNACSHCNPIDIKDNETKEK